MSKELYEYFRVAAQNNFAFADGGMPEFMDRQQLNDSARERMRALREFYDTKTDSTVGMEFLNLMRNPTDGTAFTVTRLSATQIRIASGTNDMSAYFNTNRRIQTYTAGAVTDQLHVASVVYSNPNTDVTIYTVDGSTVTAGIDEVRLHASPTLGRLAFDSTVAFPFTIPAGLTDTDFNDALAIIAGQGGGILFLLAGQHDLSTIKNIDHPIWIIGQGVDFSSCRATDGSNLAAMFDVNGLAASGVRFSNFAVYGNRGNQVSGDGDGFLIRNRASFVLFEDMYIASTRRDGVRIDNTSASSDITNVRLGNIGFDDNGGDGIRSLDPVSTMYGNFASKIWVNTPGQEQAESAGLRIAGQWNLSDIMVKNLNLGGGNTQRGIWFLERLAIDPNPQDAHLCTLSGFSIEGSGANARGIECHGERNSIGEGTISLSGGVSRGILMGGTLGQQTPQHNAVTNVLIEDANIGVLLESSCSKISIGSGVRTDACVTGMDIQGDSCEVKGARMQGGTTGLKVAASASEAIIKDNVIDGQSGNGMEIAAGATDTLVGGNTFRDITGKGILNADSSTVWWKPLNHFDNVTGFNIDENGGIEYDGTSLRKVIIGVDQLNFGGADVPVTGMSDIPFPVPPDGTRTFLIHCCLGISWESTLDDLEVELRTGTTGWATDAVHTSVVWSNAAAAEMYLVSFHGDTASGAVAYRDPGTFPVTPAANHLASIVLDSTSTIQDVHAHGNVVDGKHAKTFLTLEFIEDSA
jgi:hypothetical protein